MALKHACGTDPGIDTRRFVELSKLVGKASCRPVPEWKAVVGERVFAVESGLHADGVLKHPANYEGFDPGEVGLARQIVLGKHSGSHGLRHRLAALDIVLPVVEEQCFMTRVRCRSQELKRPLGDGDLLALLTEMHHAA